MHALPKRAHEPLKTVWLGVESKSEPAISFPFGPLSSVAALPSMNLRDPDVRATVVKQYDSYGEQFIIREYGVNRERVRQWKELFAKFGSFAPRSGQSGTKSLLSPKDIRIIEAELIANPYATNAELAAKIKNKVSPREVGNIIKKSEHQFTWKLESRDVEQTFDPQIVEEGKKFMAKTHNIPYDDRIYVDETWASAGIKRRKCRVPKSKKPWSPQNRKYPRMVIIGAITKEGWLHRGKTYNKGSITDADFDNYVKKTLAPLVTPGKVVFWDQYGRFGRVKNPTARHFSPVARKAIEKRGGKLVILTRYGKYFDPIEMLFGDTKKKYEKKVAEKTRSLMPSKLSFETKVKLWHEAEKELSPKSFHRAFKERASGKEFIRVCKERGLWENKA